MSIATQTLSAARAIGIVIGVLIAVILGFMFAVYLSLRSPEVKVPDVVGKDRFVAENELTGAGLNFRVRAIRPSNQVKADSVIFQLPRAGEVVKAGQTVAVDISRPAKEGEASETISHEGNSNAKKGNENTSTNERSSSGNLNENKPKRNRNANANNANGNANGNGNAGNRNANSNRPKPNANSDNGNVNANGSTNRRQNNNRTGETNNQNSNRPNRNVNRVPPPTQPTPPK